MYVFHRETNLNKLPPNWTHRDILQFGELVKVSMIRSKKCICCENLCEIV